MHIIFFPLFYFYFFLLGRGFILLLNKLNKRIILDDSSKLFDTPLLVFYPIIGIFLFSNISFLFHFFFPLKTPFLLLLVSILLFVNLLNLPNIKSNFLIYFITILNSFILSITSYDINFQYDAGYYHLNYQNWLREYKLVFGLSNLNGAFGTSSIIDYISAPLWINQNLILLHYITILFLAFLSTFFAYHIISSTNKYLFYSSISVGLFGFLDNFGIEGGRNGFFTIHGIIKPDIASGVMFFICCVLLTFSLIKKINDPKEIVFLNLLVVFSFQLKISTALLFLFFIFAIIKAGAFNLKLLLITNSILIPWSIKNIFLSACLVYPVNITCLNFPWYDQATVDGIKNVTGDFNNSYVVGDSVNTWFNNWISVGLNKTIVSNFGLTITLLFIIKLIFTKKNSNYSNKLFIFPIIFIFANIFLWITGAAHPRFVYGLFAYIVTLLFLNTQEFRLFKVKFPYKIIAVSILAFSTLLIPRANSYRTFYLEPFKNAFIAVPKVEYKKLNDRWVTPSIGDQCWINVDCIPYKKNIRETSYLNYKSFDVNK